MGQAFGCLVVKSSTVAITERFGKFEDILEPGCHCVPSFLGRTVAGSLSMNVQRYVVRCNTKTKDNVFATVELSIHYYPIKEKARIAYITMNGCKPFMQDYVNDVVISTLTKYDLKAAFEHKDEIERAVEKHVGQAAEAFGYKVVRVFVVDIQPDPDVKKATNTINAATKIMTVSPKDVKVDAASANDTMEKTGAFKMSMETTAAFKMSMETSGAFQMSVETTGAFKMSTETTGAFKMSMETTGAFQMSMGKIGAFQMSVEANKPMYHNLSYIPN